MKRYDVLENKVSVFEEKCELISSLHKQEDYEQALSECDKLLSAGYVCSSLLFKYGILLLLNCDDNYLDAVKFFDLGIRMENKKGCNYNEKGIFYYVYEEDHSKLEPVLRQSIDLKLKHLKEAVHYYVKSTVEEGIDTSDIDNFFEYAVGLEELKALYSGNLDLGMSTIPIDPE